MEIEEGLLIKGGEAVTRINIHRSPIAGKFGVGFLVTVWIHPRIEEFIRSLGNSEVLDVKSMGRYWVPIENTKELSVYYMSTSLGMQSADGGYFTLDRPGQPLIQSEEGGMIGHKGPPSVINLSILRLVGASEGAGVTFGVRGVYTLDALRRMRDQLMDASRQFYVTYLKPVDLSIVVSTQEINP